MSEPTCLVTGASRGIGLATALRMARLGYRLVISARRSDGLAEAARQIQSAGGVCETVVADVSRPADAERLIQAALRCCARLDVLINNAGFAVLAPLVGTSTSDFEQSIAVNCAAVFHTTRAAWPVMQAAGGGVIVNVSSLSSVDPFPGFSVYGACKAWVNLFSQATAAEGRPHGIRVHCVAPGAVETDMLRRFFPDLGAEHVLAPDDVAAVIATVCTEPMRYITGQTIFVKR